MISLYQETANALATKISEVNKATLTDSNANQHISNLVGTEVITDIDKVIARVSIVVNMTTTVIITDIKLSTDTADYVLLSGLNIGLNAGSNSLILNLEIPYIT